MKLLFLFLDGVGLGSSNPAINPFASSSMPVLESILGGKKMIADNAPIIDQHISLIPIDACMEIEGLPQSATGQATILTGINVPQELGFHYGPKPNKIIREIIQAKNYFSKLVKAGRKVDFLNAYPPRYFEAIQSGRRIHSALPLAITEAGVSLKTIDALFDGRALSADFTAQGWKDHLNFQDIPILQPQKAGERLAVLSSDNDFTLFEYWLSDVVGHSQNMESASNLLSTFDSVLEGLVNNWNFADGLIFVSSDHGNIEDLSTRRHTRNYVPALIIGDLTIRQHFFSALQNLSDIAPSFLRLFNLFL